MRTTSLLLLLPGVGLAALFPACAAAQAPPSATTTTTVAPDPGIADTPVRRRAAAWTGALRQVARKEGATLFCSVDLDSDVPNLAYGPEPRGVDTLRALGRALRLSWEEVRGVQALFPVEGGSSADLAAAAAWAASLGPADRQRLIRGEMKLSDTDPGVREHLLGLMASEPDNSFVVLDQGGDAGLRLALGAAVEFTDPGTGRRVRRTLGGGQSLPVPAAQKKTADAETRVTRVKPVGRPQPGGALDLGEGEVLTLQELLGRARDAFGVRYVVDRRIAKSHYFVNGRMDRATFEAALERVTTVPPVRPRPDAAAPLAGGTAQALFAGVSEAEAAIDVTGLRSRLRVANSQEADAVRERFGDTEKIAASDVLQNKTYTVAQLGEDKPGLAAFFAGLGLPPETRVTLTASPVLVIECAGMHQVSHGSATIGGQSAPLWMPNRTIIGLQ